MIINSRTRSFEREKKERLESSLDKSPRVEQSLLLNSFRYSRLIGTSTVGDQSWSVTAGPGGRGGNVPKTPAAFPVIRDRRETALLCNASQRVLSRLRGSLGRDRARTALLTRPITIQWAPCNFVKRDKTRRGKLRVVYFIEFERRCSR